MQILHTYTHIHIYRCLLGPELRGSKKLQNTFLVGRIVDGHYGKCRWAIRESFTNQKHGPDG